MDPLKSAAELVAEHRGDDEVAAESQTQNPKTLKEYTFQFEHRESGTKKMRRGPFTNRILTIRMRRMVGVVQAQLAGGVPWESLSPYDRDLIGKIAHLTVSLDRDRRPKWASDFEDLYDDEILDKLYTEVADHEATFHGLAQDQKVGAGDSGKDGAAGGTPDLASGQAPAA